MSKHFKPTEVTLAEFWLVIDGDERDVIATRDAAIDNLRRSYDGTTLWHCMPGEGQLRDITADIAQDWFDTEAEPGCDCPDAFRPYVGRDVEDMTWQAQRQPGAQHSTYHRGIGL